VLARSPPAAASAVMSRLITLLDLSCLQRVTASCSRCGHYYRAAVVQAAAAMLPRSPAAAASAVKRRLITSMMCASTSAVAPSGNVNSSRHDSALEELSCTAHGVKSLQQYQANIQQERRSKEERNALSHSPSCGLLHTQLLITCRMPLVPQTTSAAAGKTAP
jgi:hypothetical protein